MGWAYIHRKLFRINVQDLWEWWVPTYTVVTYLYRSYLQSRFIRQCYRRYFLSDLQVFRFYSFMSYRTGGMCSWCMPVPWGSLKGTVVVLWIRNYFFGSRSDFSGNFESSSDFGPNLIYQKESNQSFQLTAALILILNMRFLKSTCEFFVLSVKF